MALLSSPSSDVMEVRAFLRHARASLAIVFALSLWGAYVFDTRGTQSLVVEMRVDAAGSAQLFYDLGDGYNEVDSVTVSAPGSSDYSTLQFALPPYRVRSLRFDPISGPGSFSIRRVYVIDAADRVLREFGAHDLIPMNQIVARTETGADITFVTDPGANDPALQFGQANPADPHWLSSATLTRLLTPLGIALLLTVAVAAATFAASQVTALWRLVDRIASALSDSRFLVVDRFAVGCYALVTVLFIAFVSAGLNGSSISLFASHSIGEGLQPTLGTARPIRSDEWAVHTPAILNQVYRAKPFDVQSSAVGPDAASLIANIPVRHFTTVFRPQFWGFFLLPAAHGFAFYWQFKAVLLLSGVFSLLLLLARSSRIAAFGALWYGSSAYVQWTYSWPSLLPEMVGLFCLVMCSLFYMTVGRRTLLLTLAALMCVASAVNFALCAYIPHQIPLVWLGVFLCAWWLWANSASIFSRDHALQRAVALIGTAVFVAVAMLAFYRDAEVTILAAANTIYPGRRTMTGGHYQISMFFSHFFGFWTDDRTFPLRQAFGNICECSGFFWLAPISAFGLMRTTAGEAQKRRAYAVLAIFGALLFAWLTVPLPEIVGSLTLMNKSGVGRSLHALGLVNVALVAVALSLNQAPRRSDLKQTLVFAGAVFAALYPVALLSNLALGQFLTAGQTVMASVYFTVVIVALVEARLAALATLLVLPQLAVFGLVNPIDRGLRVIESAPLFKFVQSRPDLLRDRWIVFSDSFTHSDFFSAVGCEVITGLRYIPDLKALSVFEPSAQEQSAINRSGLFVARPAYRGNQARFEQLADFSVMWYVSPLDPRLRQIGVRYAAFATPPPADVERHLKPLGASSVSGFWLYELP